jgi:hypothetical protein
LEVEELIEQINDLSEKLNKTQRRSAGLREKSKILEQQYEDARARESNSNELIMEILQRQKELNVMLNRANMMLQRTQETIAITSMEFHELTKSLPAPEKKQLSDKINRINELFKKTGIEDAETAQEKDIEQRNEPVQEYDSKPDVESYDESDEPVKKSWWRFS